MVSVGLKVLPLQCKASPPLPPPKTRGSQSNNVEGRLSYHRGDIHGNDRSATMVPSITSRSLGHVSLYLREKGFLSFESIMFASLKQYYDNYLLSSHLPYLTDHSSSRHVASLTSKLMNRDVRSKMPWDLVASCSQGALRGMYDP